MKTKILSLLTGMLLINLLTPSNARAQQEQKFAFSNSSLRPEISNPKEAIYTYRIFEAPNKMFGYDIFKNGRPIFHQVVLTFITDDGKRAFATKPQTQKVAALAIEKIKKGIPPTMNEVEIKRMAVQ